MEDSREVIDTDRAQLFSGAKTAAKWGAAALGACVAAPILLAAAGYGSVGIAAGSVATACYGSYALSETALNKTKFSEDNLKKAFLRNDTSSNGTLQYHELKHLVQNDLKIHISDENLFKVYKDITRNEDYGPITLNQFLLMFGFNSEKESKGKEDSFPSNYELFRKFKEFDDDDDGLISYEQFWDSLDDMKIEFSSVEMREVYTSVTGSSERPFRQIDFQNYVKIINTLQ